jgi:hypothetical protein
VAATLPGVLVRFAVSCAVVSLAVAACGGGTPTARQDRTAAVYTAILRAVLPADANGGVAYVAPFPQQKSVSLETQAAVIADLADQATVRFVDALSEAVDAGAAGSPAKEGVVVLLGPVPAAGAAVEVEAETYESENVHESIRFRVSAVGEQWRAEPVEEHAIPPTTSP